MNFKEKIYDLSPIFLQNIFISIAGYQRNKFRYGKTYYEYRAFLSKFDTWSLEDKLKHQLTELKNFIRYSVDNSRFYKNLYQHLNVESIRTIEDLAQFPMVDKELLRKNLANVFTIPKKGSVEGHTGGTTGKSLVTLRTKEDMMKRMAMLDHFKSRLGFEHLKMRRASFNGKHIVPPNQKRKIFWRYNASCKQMIYSSFHLTEENLNHYIKSLNQFKPKSIDGFFSSICDVASFIERHNIKLTFTPIAIFPTSETLTQSGRDLLQRVFKCKVYDQYASSEGAPFVTECKNQVLHVELASGVFENFEPGNNEVLVTSFTSHGTPLIRYRIGDTMVFADNATKCSCGLNTPIVREIQGRRVEFLYNADGTKINGVNVANLFKNIPNAIVRAQTLQYKTNEIIIKLEVDSNLYMPEYDDQLRDEFHHKFGSKTTIRIEHVNMIPKEKNGKFRLIKNFIADGKN